MSSYDPGNPQNPPSPQEPGNSQPNYPPQPSWYPPQQPGYPGAPYPGQPDYPPQQRRNNAGVIAVAIVGGILLCVLGCVGGLVALGRIGQGAASNILTTLAPTETALAQQLTPSPGGQATCDLSTHVCDKAPIMTIDPSKTYLATIETAKGNIVIQLDAKNTPIAANNFVFLSERRFYDNTYFWRVEAPGLTSPLGGPSTLQLIQGGSVTPNGQDSASVPGYTFNDETVTGDYTAGDVAMANRGPNTNGAQFFICTGDNSTQISKNYTIFGHVISGLDVAKMISAGDIIKTVIIQVK